MAKLFVVATPLQMLVAQQLIRQEKIKDAVLLESSFAGFNSFQPSYDVCRIDGLWSKRLKPIMDFPSWDSQGINLSRSAQKTYNRYKDFRKLLCDNNIDTIYLADYQNQTYRFMTEVLTHDGYKVCFFEEGYSHYVPRVGKVNSGLVAKLKELFLDIFYYLPFYHIRFAKWRNNPNRPYEGLHIFKRYSIVPGFHCKDYDERLYCEPMISEKLTGILKEAVEEDDKNLVLLLTDPMTEVLSSDYKYLYYEVLKNSLADINSDYIVYLKFHPRDTEEARQKTIELVKSLGLNFRILSTKVNIPVEYFLIGSKFEEIFFFNTSTYFYNGYMFPKCNFHQLLPELLNLCILHGAPSASIEQISLLIEKMNKLGS